MRWYYSAQYPGDAVWSARGIRFQDFRKVIEASDKLSAFTEYVMNAYSAGEPSVRICLLIEFASLAEVISSDERDDFYELDRKYWAVRGLV
jgi:hypothetical protein